MSSSQQAAGGGDDNMDATSPNPWEQARDESSQLILQSALQELETRAAKQQEDFMQTRQKATELEATLQVSQSKIDDLQKQLQSKTEAYDALKLELQTTTSKSKSMQESTKTTQERMDRLEEEADKLRGEIRYASFLFVFICFLLLLDMNSRLISIFLSCIDYLVD